LNRPLFDKKLANIAIERGAKLYTKTKVIRINHLRQGKWAIELLNNGSKSILNCDFIIDASGRNSRIHKAFKIERTIFDRLIGITGFVQLKDISNQSYMSIEAVEEGWWYAACIPEYQLTITYFTENDFLRNTSLKTNEFWKYQLNKTKIIKTRLSDSYQSVNTYARSAVTSSVASFSGVDWLAVGDAAMSYDPLSGQGIEKGITMGLNAAQSIIAWNGGQKNALQEYDEKYHAIFDEYLNFWRKYYLMESRWSERVFWLRRQGNL